MSHFTGYPSTPAQKEAVLNYDKPSLIVAGAGSGKTRVLTSRIAYMIEQGVHPGSILALTFTNKAAREMRERIEQLVPDGRARYIWMGTFHSRLLPHPAAGGRETRFRRQLHDIRHGKQRKPALDHHQGAKPQYRRIQAARHPLPHLAGEKQSRDCRGLCGQHLVRRRRPAAEASRILRHLPRIRPEVQGQQRHGFRRPADIRQHPFPGLSRRAGTIPGTGSGTSS